MNATYGVPMAARVPEDLKAAAVAAVHAGQWEDLSTILRLGAGIALKLGRREASAALARLENGGTLLDPGGTSTHRLGHATERVAADRAGRGAGQSRKEVLELAAAAGSHGITADEVVIALGHRWAVNGLPRRVTDLVQADALEPKTVIEEDPPGVVLRLVHRLTRTGSPANVYVITELGRAALANGAAPKPPRRAAA